MNRTGIEWCDRTWNPVTGCKHDCSYCYARRMVEEGRLKNSPGYPNGFAPAFHPERVRAPLANKRTLKIFVSSMGDLFGSWVPTEWIEAVLAVCREAPWHHFMLLTKNPRRYAEFTPLPANVWLGVSGTTPSEVAARGDILRGIETDGFKFVSVEPIKPGAWRPGTVGDSLDAFDWTIVGCETGPKAPPPDVEGVRAIVDHVAASTTLFLKGNTSIEGPMHCPEDFLRAG